MSRKSDIEIASSVKPHHILEIGKKAKIEEEYLEQYGKYKAKISYDFINKNKDNGERGKLVLVTAINPTPAGEGKTTTTIGIADALNKLGKKAILALREPSLGPVFGIKGGATGGGYAQVIPMEDINLHFTGDFHAIGAANNLLAAMIDNHIYQGNSLNIDPSQIVWRRVVDMNDRQLRNIVSGLGGRTNGRPREDGYDITVASEVMAVFCLADSLGDLKERLSKMIVAYTYDNQPVKAGDLKASGAMTALLRDAFMPNLVQTLEHNPAIIHGGPFANIAHGCNSMIATKLALSLGEYTITEAGFGADLGAEKFFDIKCRAGGLKPDLVVIVATIRALKHHGHAGKNDLSKEDFTSLGKGLPNLLQHIENIRKIYKLPCLVAINVFPTDTKREIEFLEKKCNELGINVKISRAWEEGGQGAIDLAKEIISLTEAESEAKFDFAYDLNSTIEEKINNICKKIYRAESVQFENKAKKAIKKFEEMGYHDLPICMAKTQYSFSDKGDLLGAPSGFKITIKDLKISAGAGFIVALAGNIMTMPGLGKTPSATIIDVDDNGKIRGLS